MVSYFLCLFLPLLSRRRRGLADYLEQHRSTIHSTSNIIAKEITKPKRWRVEKIITPPNCCQVPHSFLLLLKKKVSSIRIKPI